MNGAFSSQKQRSLRLLLIVANHPLLLPATIRLGSADRPLNTVDDPTIALGVSVDHVEGEHRQHKLSLHGLKKKQKLLQVLHVECILIMSTIGVHIRWINEMKGIRCIVARDHIKCIPVLNRHSLKSCTELFGKFILGVAQFLGHHTSEVVPERPVQH